MEDLATALATCGISEAKVYKMISDGIDEGTLTLTDENITTPADDFIAEVEYLLSKKKEEARKSNVD